MAPPVGPQGWRLPRSHWQRFVCGAPPLSDNHSAKRVPLGHSIPHPISAHFRAADRRTSRGATPNPFIHAPIRQATATKPTSAKRTATKRTSANRVFTGLASTEFVSTSLVATKFASAKCRSAKLPSTKLVATPPLGQGAARQHCILGLRND
jgi:hypothetical protein